MPLATAMAECWKRAIEKAGELPIKGKLKDLGKTLEQQILPYLVQELVSLSGRASASAPKPGDAPPTYFRILDSQLEALAEYRKSLEQRISLPIAGSPERIADYA